MKNWKIYSRKTNMVLTVEAVLISSPLKSIWPTSVSQNRPEVSCRVTYDSATALSLDESKVHKLKVGHSSNLKHSKLTWRQSSCDSCEMYQISTSRNGNDLRQLSFWYRALSCGADRFTKGVYIWVTHLHIAVPSVPYATRTPQVKNNMDRN